MKKKGFTLVELLAVIAILAILVIIALPNVMGMFNQVKKNSFTTEVKNIFQVAQQQWMTDSMLNTGDKYYARITSGGTNTATCGDELSLSGRTELNYAIKINKAGQVIEYYATDGTYMLAYKASTGKSLKIEDIKNDDTNATSYTFSNDDVKVYTLTDIGKKGDTIVCSRTGTAPNYTYTLTNTPVAN